MCGLLVVLYSSRPSYTHALRHPAACAGVSSRRLGASGQPLDENQNDPSLPRPQVLLANAGKWGAPLLWLHLLSKPGVLFEHGGNIAQMTKQMPPEISTAGFLRMAMVSAIWTPTACAAEQPGEARGKAREQPRLLTYHSPTSYCLVGNDGVARPAPTSTLPDPQEFQAWRCRERPPPHRPPQGGRCRHLDRRVPFILYPLETV